MSIVVAGITALEQWDDYSVGVGANGPYETISYVIPWADVTTFLTAVRGGITWVGGANGSLQRNPRLRSPANPNLAAVDANAIGQGEAAIGAAGRPTFTLAKVMIRFEVLPWSELGNPNDTEQSFPDKDDEPITYAECSIDYGGEYVVAGKDVLVFTSDQLAIQDGKIGIHVGMNTFKIVHHEWPYLPYDLTTAFINKINDVPIFGQARGTVRFAGGNTKQVFTSDGDKVQEWEQTYEVREYDWNYYLRPDSPVFAEVSKKGDATVKPYIYADLTPLITPPDA